ncbi:MAG TPA: alpha/beta hydrolase [Candidatus Bathyarchaeia archaeon]|nr:alpha/beta hydrolase [Candidatus Bathyarchaeia archaeon]
MAERADFPHPPSLSKGATYEFGGTNIRVKVREFLPGKEAYNPQEALVLFHGWGFTEKARSYDELANGLAKCFKRRVLLVDTRAEKLVEDSLYHEAKAVHQFLKEMGISDVVAAGYSRGGAEAVNFAAIPQIEKAKEAPSDEEFCGIGALLLVAPVGLRAQTPNELIETFMEDLKGTRKKIMEEKIVGQHGAGKESKYGEYEERGRVGKIMKIVKAGGDIIGGLGGEVVRSNVRYRQRFDHQVEEMAQLNPRLARVNVPVVLIQGKYDLPAGPETALAKGQMAEQDPSGIVKKTLSSLFPGSPYVTRVLAERSGNHAFALVRSEQLARVMHYLFQRQNQANNHK